MIKDTQWLLEEAEATIRELKAENASLVKQLNEFGFQELSRLRVENTKLQTDVMELDGRLIALRSSAELLCNSVLHMNRMRDRAKKLKEMVSE